jgi:hypothetical protein
LFAVNAATMEERVWISFADGATERLSTTMDV